MLDLLICHIPCAGSRRWCCTSRFTGLARLAPLAAIRLALRSCWHDVSPKCGNAGRHGRVSESLTLSWRLLEQGTFARWGARGSGAGVIDLAQGVARMG